MKYATKCGKALTLTLTGFLLTACGGGDEAAYPYSPLNGAPTGAPLNIRGTAASSTEVASVTGTSDTEGEFEMSAGTVATFSAGYNLTAEGTAVYDESFEYLRTFEAGMQTGIAGVATDPSTMPSSGSATYSGRSKAALIADGAIHSLNSGDATVEVDFANGEADVVMNNFTVDTILGSSAAPIDEIHISNMAISGTSFSGGDITTFNGGAVVGDITGLTPTSNAAGEFFGPIDAGTGAPDEVGGTFLLTGFSGTLAGDFAAD